MGSSCFLRDGIETGMDVVAGLHRPVEQVDCIGQRFFKALQPLLTDAQDIQERRDSQYQCKADAKNEQIQSQHPEQKVGRGCDNQANCEYFGRAVLQVGLIDELLQAPQHADPFDEIT